MSEETNTNRPNSISQYLQVCGRMTQHQAIWVTGELVSLIQSSRRQYGCYTAIEADRVLLTQEYHPVLSPDIEQTPNGDASLEAGALGSLLYLMLTGRKPPEISQTPGDGISTQPLKDCGVSQPLVAVIKRAMMRERGMRYSDVDDFRKAMDFVIYLDRQSGNVPEELRLNYQEGLQNSLTQRQIENSQEMDGVNNSPDIANDDKGFWHQPSVIISTIAVLAAIIITALLLCG